MKIAARLRVAVFLVFAGLVLIQLLAAAGALAVALFRDESLNLGDFRAYSTLVEIGLVLGGLTVLLLILGSAAALRRITGRENMVTRFFEPRRGGLDDAR